MAGVGEQGGIGIGLEELRMKEMGWGEIGREGSLVYERSSGEADRGLGEVGVEKRGQRKRMMGVWRRGLDRG